MQLFKKFLTFAGFALIAFQVNAQIVNGDFTNGPSSWAWKQAESASISVSACSSLQAFTPTWNKDTPFINNVYSGFGTQFGRVAKAHADNVTFADSGSLCRTMAQDFFVPIGSEVQFDLFTDAGRSSSACIGCSYSNASIKIEISDISSGLTRTYDPIPVSYIPPSCPIGSTCNYFSKYRVLLDSVFWGKSVKFTVITGTTFRKGVAGGGSLYPANVYLDNFAISKPPTINVLPKTGAWYNPARSGHGFHLSKSSDGRYVLIWYTYLANGKPIWYISDTVAVTNGVLTSKIYKSTWNYATQTNTRIAIGDVKLEMHYADSFTFSWDLYSVNGDGAGFDGGEPMTHLFGGESYTGLWYEPALSGYGYSIDYKNNSSGIDTSATVFYYINGEPVWARGDKEGAPILNNTVPLTAYVGVGLCPECNGQTVIKTPSPIGEAGLSFDVNKSWVYLQDSTGTPVWQRGLPTQSVDTNRLTYP
jgi:hypothetical protein